MMEHLAAKATVAAYQTADQHAQVAALSGVQAKVSNPLDKVNPSLSLFGGTFQTKVQTILGGVWMLVILLTVGYLLLGFAKYGSAKRVGHSDDLGEGSEKMQRAGIALGCEVAATAIVGAIITLAG